MFTPRFLTRTACILCCFSPLALADHVTLSGLFVGDEPTLAPFPESCTQPDSALGYLEAGPIEVSASGVYDVVDAGNLSAVDVVIRIYQGSFDPGDISANLVAAVDEGEQIDLVSGQSYRLVLQHWCTNETGAWGVAVSGPGRITGNGVVISPARTLGTFTDDDSRADFGFGATVYDVHGPVRFDQEGTYFYADLSIHRRVDMELYVYEGSFEPLNTSLNLVAVLDDDDAVDLETGVDYFLVSAPFNIDDFGEWHYTMFPPGRVLINRFLSGAWFDADSSVEGQGFLMEVFPSLSFVFMAWFTFEQEGQLSTDSAGGKTPLAIGASDQRWLTAFGNYDDGATSMSLQFENTTGGVFNAPPIDLDQDSNYGTGTLTADGCGELTLEFDLPDGPAQDSISLNRVEDSLVMTLCGNTGTRPGVIQ